VVATSWLAGSVPFAQLVAQRCTGIDLRTVGTGTVSGSALYHVAGTGPLVVAGVLDVAKGAVGPVLAGADRPALQAAAAAAAVCGHDWSPWLGGAGGRGVSVALGALTVVEPMAAAGLLGTLTLGRLAGDNAGVATLVGWGVVAAVLRARRGRHGTLLAVALVAPMAVKRLAGNGPAQDGATYLWRTLYDRDSRHEMRPRRAVGVRAR
jgi:glycerol-3-phosphate acyltransferase PlsY